MQISAVELYYVSIPLSLRRAYFLSTPTYFEPSWIPGFRQSEMRFYLLRLETDSGLAGHAAMAAMGSEKKGLGTLIGPYLLGLDPLDIKMVNQRLQEISYVGMRNGWIDAAFYDLIGQIKKQPVWQLLGGSGGSVFPYASTGATHNHDCQHFAENSRRLQDLGYQGLKLRIKSNQLDPMLEAVQSAREAVGKEMRIMVDANQGWPVDIVDPTPRWDEDFALSVARGLEPFKIYWLEEPLNRGNLEGLARLRKKTKTPIAGGEMNSSWRDFKAMLSLESLDVYQPDAVLVGGTYAGGISVIYWLLKEIERRNKKLKDKIKFSPHTWTTGLGFIVGLHLVGLLPQKERSLLEYPLEGAWRPELWAHYLKNPPRPDREGRLHLPTEPGLGATIDWDVIRKFGRRIYRGTKGSISRYVLGDRGLKMALYLKQKKAAELAARSPVAFEMPEAPF